MIKVAHEAPIYLFDTVQTKTDYDYCLCHLYVENKEYRTKFLEAKAKGREIILDTSVFELGESFDETEYIKVIKELEPEWYIVPDVLENREETQRNLLRWNEEYIPNLPGKAIAVLQGKNIKEVEGLYYLARAINIPKIAISFDYSLYSEIFPHKNLHVSRMLGRVWLINHLSRLTPEHTSKFTSPLNVHLLGCSLPQEGLFYSQNDHVGYEFIDSIDTSNPVVHGFKHIKYSDQGLWDKESVKLFTLIDDTSSGCSPSIFGNISRFRWFWNQTYKMISE